MNKPKKPTFERFSTFEELKGIKKPNQEDTKVVSLNNGTAEVSDLYINGELHVPMKFVESYSGMEREKIIKQYNKWKVNQKL